MTQIDTIWRGFGDPAGSQSVGSFAPDHFAYDMIRLAFLPWSMFEETTRRLAAALDPAGAAR